MALNIPLPKAPSGGFFGGLEAGNELTNALLQNKIKQAEAQYAPYTQYANAASKIAYANLLPYQVQASVLSNPLMWAAMSGDKQALNSLMQNFSKSIPDTSQIMKNVPMPPAPATTGNSLLGMLMGKLGNIFSSAQPDTGANVPIISSIPSATTANIPDVSGQAIPKSVTQGTTEETGQKQERARLSPASQGGVEGVLGKQTAPYVQQPYESGKVVTIDGKDISVPANSTVSDVQQAYVGIKNALPILNNIAKHAPEFLQKGAKGKILATQIDGLIKQWGNVDLIPDWIKKRLGIDPAMLSRYAEWKTEIEKAPEPLMSAFKLLQNELSLRKVSKIVEPIWGESGEGYQKRVLNEISSLTGDRLPLYKNILASGIQVSGKENESTATSGKGQLFGVYDKNGNLVARGKEKNVDRFIKDHKGYYKQALSYE